MHSARSSVLSASAGGVSDHDGDQWHEVGGGGQWPDGRARFLMLREGDWNGRTDFRLPERKSTGSRWSGSYSRSPIATSRAMAPWWTAAA